MADKNIEDVIIFFETILEIIETPIDFEKLSDHYANGFAGLETFFDLFTVSEKLNFFKQYESFSVNGDGMVSLLDNEIIDTCVNHLKICGSDHFEKLFKKVIEENKYIKAHSVSEKFKFFRDHTKYFSIKSDGYVELCKSPKRDPIVSADDEIQLLTFFNHLLSSIGPMYFAWFLEYLEESSVCSETVIQCLTYHSLWSILSCSPQFILDNNGFVQLHSLSRSDPPITSVEKEEQVVGLFVTKLMYHGFVIYSLLIKWLQQSDLEARNFFAGYSMQEVLNFFSKRSDIFYVKRTYISLKGIIHLDGLIHFHGNQLLFKEKQEAIFFFLQCLKENNPIHFLKLSNLFKESNIESGFKGIFSELSISDKHWFFKDNPDIFYVENSGHIHLHKISNLSQMGKYVIRNFVQQLEITTRLNFWSLICSSMSLCSTIKTYFQNFLPVNKFYFFKKFADVFDVDSNGLVHYNVKDMLCTEQEEPRTLNNIEASNNESLLIKSINFQDCKYDVTTNKDTFKSTEKDRSISFSNSDEMLSNFDQNDASICITSIDSDSTESNYTDNIESLKSKRTNSSLSSESTKKVMSNNVELHEDSCIFEDCSEKIVQIPKKLEIDFPEKPLQELEDSRRKNKQNLIQSKKICENNDKFQEEEIIATLKNALKVHHEMHYRKLCKFNTTVTKYFKKFSDSNRYHFLRKHSEHFDIGIDHYVRLQHTIKLPKCTKSLSEVNDNSSEKSLQELEASGGKNNQNLIQCENFCDNDDEFQEEEIISILKNVLKDHQAMHYQKLCKFDETLREYFKRYSNFDQCHFFKKHSEHFDIGVSKYVTLRTIKHSNCTNSFNAEAECTNCYNAETKCTNSTNDLSEVDDNSLFKSQKLEDIFKKHRKYNSIDNEKYVMLCDEGTVENAGQIAFCNEIDIDDHKSNIDSLPEHVFENSNLKTVESLNVERFNTIPHKTQVENNTIKNSTDSNATLNIQQSQDIEEKYVIGIMEKQLCISKKMKFTKLIKYVETHDERARNFFASYTPNMKRTFIKSYPDIFPFDRKSVVYSKCDTVYVEKKEEARRKKEEVRRKKEEVRREKEGTRKRKIEVHKNILRTFIDILKLRKEIHFKDLCAYSKCEDVVSYFENANINQKFGFFHFRPEYFSIINGMVSLSDNYLEAKGEDINNTASLKETDSLLTQEQRKNISKSEIIKLFCEKLKHVEQMHFSELCGMKEVSNYVQIRCEKQKLKFFRKHCEFFAISDDGYIRLSKVSLEKQVIESLLIELKSIKCEHFEKLCKLSTVKNFFKNYSTSKKFNFFENHPEVFYIDDDDGYVVSSEFLESRSLSPSITSEDLPEDDDFYYSDSKTPTSDYPVVNESGNGVENEEDTTTENSNIRSCDQTEVPLVECESSNKSEIQEENVVTTPIKSTSSDEQPTSNLNCEEDKFLVSTDEYQCVKKHLNYFPSNYVNQSDTKDIGNDAIGSKNISMVLDDDDNKSPLQPMKIQSDFEGNSSSPIIKFPSKCSIPPISPSSNTGNLINSSESNDNNYEPPTERNKNNPPSDQLKITFDYKQEVFHVLSNQLKCHNVLHFTKLYEFCETSSELVKLYFRDFSTAEKYEFLLNFPESFNVDTEGFVKIGKANVSENCLSDDKSKSDSIVDSSDKVRCSKLHISNFHMMAIKCFVETLQNTSSLHYKEIIKIVCLKYDDIKQFFMFFKKSDDLIDFYKLHLMYFSIDEQLNVSLKQNTITGDDVFSSGEELEAVISSLISKALELYIEKLKHTPEMSINDLKNHLNSLPGYVISFMYDNYPNDNLLNFFRLHANYFLVQDNRFVTLNEHLLSMEDIDSSILSNYKFNKSSICFNVECQAGSNPKISEIFHANKILDKSSAEAKSSSDEKVPSIDTQDKMKKRKKLRWSEIISKERMDIIRGKRSLPVSSDSLSFSQPENFKSNVIQRSGAIVDTTRKQSIQMDKATPATNLNKSINIPMVPPTRLLFTQNASQNWLQNVTSQPRIPVISMSTYKSHPQIAPMIGVPALAAPPILMSNTAPLLRTPFQVPIQQLQNNRPSSMLNKYPSPMLNRYPSPMLNNYSSPMLNNYSSPVMNNSPSSVMNDYPSMLNYLFTSCKNPLIKELNTIAEMFDPYLDEKCVTFFTKVIKSLPEVPHITLLSMCVTKSSKEIQLYLTHYIKEDLLVFFYLHLDYFVIDSLGHVSLRTAIKPKECNELEILAINFFKSIVCFNFKRKVSSEILENSLQFASKDVQNHVRRNYSSNFLLFFCNHVDDFEVDILNNIGIKYNRNMDEHIF